jgi:hypothetical protein
MSKRRTFGQLSKRAQDRALRIGDGYGLSRKQVIDRYNRGTFNPYSRTRPQLRVPSELRRFTPSDTGITDWRAAALANIRYHLSDYWKFNNFTVTENVDEHASPELLKIIALASEGELIEFALVQEEDIDSLELPHGLTKADIGYYVHGKKSGKPEWVNIFWYH